MSITLKLKRQPDDDEEEGYLKRDKVARLFAQDYTGFSLQPDHKDRPLFVCNDGKIILEVSRPARIHEFKLTPYSLYAAVSVGMQTNDILTVLSGFSKNKLPDKIVQFIKQSTQNCGKIKLVLKQSKYYLESNYPDLIKRLLNDPTIKQARVTTAESQKLNIKEDEFGAIITLDREDEEEEMESDFTCSFQISKEKVEEEYPLMEEYDFRMDTLNANLDIDLSPKTIIRDYQEKSLSKMFGGGSGRARSGIIVLPTGAGKTLVGITAACTVKKSTIILCTNALSVEQWANELKKWSTIQEHQIAKFTASSKEKFSGDAGIVISTYTMISHSGKRAMDTSKMIEFVNQHEWGLMILDEVHVVPANVFRKVLSTVASHTKLGLTATLVREDDKIDDLNFLIGPKLFEANWMDLATRGHIAKVEATEIWCPMTGDFYQEYLKCTSKAGKRRLLCVMNPSKFMATEYLIKWRESQGDKIIVFSDNVFALQHYAVKLNRPYIYGGTSHEERTRVLTLFRRGDNPTFRTIFLSKVGDTSLDLPEATCLIQISSQFGSRRQEAQRMGRILRAKRRNEEGFKSRFYTLVSKDTDEVQFSQKRRTFLVDQGYEFHVIPNFASLIPHDEMTKLNYFKQRDQDELLSIIQQQGDEVGMDEVVETSVDDLAGEWQNQARRKKEPKKEKVPEKKRHALFRGR
ncbi:hypothetical protein HK103_005686 [Boothiomyces macroporosus]|uniref:DNA 3'-5' helicase n=1 Tax=Boothiomyces macroporosus TaxID=261099 RepID=A0AAD5Y532_9FUNG|nr:hypothetical protein HK103_005686 [Boothiomyces macroporosus]